MSYFNLKRFIYREKPQLSCMAYLRDNKEISIKALVARHTEALGTLQTTQHKGEKSAGYVWNKIAGDLGRRHTLGLYLEEPKKEPSPSLLKKHAKNKTLPILHVYLDSQALIQDFSTDAVLYQAKMAHEGLPLQKIKFHLSKKIQGNKRRTNEGIPHNSQGAVNSSFKNSFQDKTAPLVEVSIAHNSIKEQEEAAWILRHKKGAQLAPNDDKKKTPFNELPPLSPTEIQFIQRNVHTLPADLKRVAISAMSARLRRQKDNQKAL